MSLTFFHLAAIACHADGRPAIGIIGACLDKMNIGPTSTPSFGCHGTAIKTLNMRSFI